MLFSIHYIQRYDCKKTKAVVFVSKKDKNISKKHTALLFDMAWGRLLR